MKRSFSILAVSLLFAATSGAQVFPNRPLADVLKDAGAANKLVFVDFYANWCGPCKLIDAVVYPDPKVKAWLDQYTIPISIDGERGEGPEIREKYDAKAYPTLLLLKPDGKELGRHTGSLSADDFLAEFEGFRSGSDRRGVLEEAVAKNPKDPIPHFQLALLLQDDGKKEEAREHFAALLETSSAYTSYGARKLLALDENKDATVKKVEARTDALLKSALEGTATSGDVEALVGLLALRGRRDDLVRLQAAMQGKELERSVNVEVDELAAEALIELAKPADAIPILQACLDRLESKPLPVDATREDLFDEKGQKRKLYGALYKALLMAGKPDEARAAAEKAVSAIPDVDTFNELAWGAFVIQKSDDFTVQLAQNGHDLAGGVDLNMADTLANVLNQVGRKDDAVKVIDAAIATTNHERRIKEFKELRESITNPKKDETKKS